MITININASDFGNDPVQIADFVRKVKAEIAPDPIQKAASSNENNNGPLTLQWFAESKSTRIRRNDGRTAEQQAEHNLRKYKGYTDWDIAAILEGSFTEKADNDVEVTSNKTEKETFDDGDLI